MWSQLNRQMNKVQITKGQKEYFIHTCSMVSLRYRCVTCCMTPCSHKQLKPFMLSHFWCDNCKMIAYLPGSPHCKSQKGKNGHGPEKELHTPLMTSCCLSPPPSPLNEVLDVNEHWGVLPKQLDDSDKATFSITRVTCNNCQSPQLRFPWLLGTLWNVRQPCPTKLLLLIARNLMHNLP